MAKTSYPLKAPEEDFARWRAAAAGRGVSLAVFLRDAADEAATATAPRPARKRGEKRGRTAMCEHRRGPDEYCSRCDP